MFIGAFPMGIGIASISRRDANIEIGMNFTDSLLDVLVELVLGNGSLTAVSLSLRLCPV